MVRLPDCTHCDPELLTVHHKRGRGPYLLDTTTWLAACMSCHRYIEDHPEIAKENGWSESRMMKNDKGRKKTRQDTQNDSSLQETSGVGNDGERKDPEETSSQIHEDTPLSDPGERRAPLQEDA